MGGPDTSRRAFLRAAGIAGVGGLANTAGCTGSAPPTADRTDATSRKSLDETASATFRNGLRRHGHRPEATVPDAVQTAWRLPGVNTGDHTAAKASAVETPGGRYLIPGDTGDVQAVSPDGRVEWSASTDPSSRGIHGTPTVANGHAYVGAYDGALYAFDLETGGRAWKQGLGGSIGSSPGYHDGTVYIAVEFPDPSGAVFGVDARTGEVTWRDDAPTDHPHSTLAIDREAGRLVVGANDGVLYAWSYPDLERAWTAETGGAIKGPVAAVDGSAVFGSWDGNVYRVALGDGAVEWTVETPAKVMGAPAVDAGAGVVYVGGHDATLRAIDLATGDVGWEYPTGGWIIGAAKATRDHVLVGSYDGRLHAVTRDGERAWVATAGGHVSSDPLVDDGGVVFTERATDERAGRAVKLVPNG